MITKAIIEVELKRMVPPQSKLKDYELQQLTFLKQQTISVLHI